MQPLSLGSSSRCTTLTHKCILLFSIILSDHAIQSPLSFLPINVVTTSTLRHVPRLPLYLEYTCYPLNVCIIRFVALRLSPEKRIRPRNSPVTTSLHVRRPDAHACASPSSYVSTSSYPPTFAVAHRLPSSVVTSEAVVVSITRLFAASESHARVKPHLVVHIYTSDAASYLSRLDERASAVQSRLALPSIEVHTSGLVVPGGRGVGRWPERRASLEPRTRTRGHLTSISSDTIVPPSTRRRSLFRPMGALCRASARRIVGESLPLDGLPLSDCV
jgi:hypothetical protein